MTNNQNQPNQYDAVLGGNAPPPIHGAVLGGIEGVKKRLDSSNIDVQISALNDALNYGDVGLDLVINNLENESSQINYLATRILKRHKNIKGKQALLKYNPKLSFIRLEDWEQQYYNPKI
ncbi:MAG: HEAT repeat domain-containing protein, partial [Cyanobacteria bacterium J06636_27]